MIEIFPSIKYLNTSDFEIKKTCLSNGIKINHAAIGHGKIIVMIHGMANNWISLVPMARKLKDKYKVILIDLPGYGDSSRLDRYSVKILADYLNRFINTLDQKPLAIVGFSMSGSIVTQAVKINPDISDKIIILSPYISYVNKINLSKLNYSLYQFFAAHKKLHPLLKKIIESRIGGYLAGLYLNMYHFDAKKIDTLSLIGRKKLDLPVYWQMGVSTMDYRLSNSLFQINLPTLLLVGEHDKINSPEQIRQILSELRPNMKIIDIADSGHALNMEAIGPCAREIKDFIDPA